jgi:predicted lipid-binding transport protein (Tim44 family)
MTFDPLNLLLLAIALVVFWRLKSVLGTRTGNERPPADPIGTGRAGETSRTSGEANGKVLQFPKSEEGGIQTGAAEPSVPVEVWAGIAEPGSDLALGLEKLAASDAAFNPGVFVEGAKLAYEMIIDGFAKGDKAALKNLLSKDVFDGFAKAIDNRELEGQRIESRFVGIDKAAIMAAGVSGNKASITMQFISEMISATYDKSGAVVDGDPKQIREITDVWTFERDVTSRNPNWKLSATQAQA